MTSLDRRIQRQETCRQQNRLPSETCLEESFRGLTIGGVVHLTERQYKLNRMTILVGMRSEEHTSELQSLRHLVCRLLLEKKIITDCGSVCDARRPSRGPFQPRVAVV